MGGHFEPKGPGWVDIVNTEVVRAARMLDLLATVFNSPPYPVFQARQDAVQGRCALRHCAEQFNSSPGFSLDNSGATGNIIAVGNRGVFA